jgi:DNA-binding transcriptional regulator LsrR (DeoR family)
VARLVQGQVAKELGMPENSVRRLLDLRHASQMRIIDAALAKMNAELPIDLPKVRPTREGGVAAGAFS